MSDRSTELAAWQRWLLARVTEPAAVDAPDLASTAAAAADVTCQVRAGRLSPRARLEVYRHGYVARLVECLEDDYPALQHALGPEAFDELCRSFVARHPPRSPSLNYYGAPFAAHCAASAEPWATFAAELAALEWALVEAIHAPEGERLDGAALAQLSVDEWSRARLVPSPSLCLLDTVYPVGSYYRAFRAGDVPAQRLPGAERSGLAVCRRGVDVWRAHVDVDLLPVLASLIAGTPLLAALAAAPPTAGAHPEALQRAFRDWVACGLFSALVVQPASPPA